MIKQVDRKETRSMFGVDFYYSEKNGVGKVKVMRLNSDEVLQEIKFFGNDRLKTKLEFNDVCTMWCDQHAA